MAVVLGALAAAGLRLGEEPELRSAPPHLKFSGMSDLGPLRGRMRESGQGPEGARRGPWPGWPLEADRGA